MPLYIKQGSPHWWLSTSIWVTPAGTPSTTLPVTNPIAGKNYDVWVSISNPYDGEVDDWSLFICWAIPTPGAILLPPAAQWIYNAPLGPIAANTPPTTFPASPAVANWQPSYHNGGHECLVAVAYDQTGGLPGGLQGNTVPNEGFSIAQHNLGVLPVGSQGRRRINYAFQVCNDADEHRRFVVEAQQAPLAEIAEFLPGLPGGRAVLDKPGKVERLGVVASAHPDPAELDAATAVLTHVEIAPRSCRPFTLGGSLEQGNALIHVAQRLDERLVGGFSVLVMAEEK